MIVRFIGQGYNTGVATSGAEELTKALRDNRFTNFTCLVAFASTNGIAALRPHIQAAKNHISHFKIIIGIDQKATSKEALTELLLWDANVFIYYTTQRNIFHPKIYIFTGEHDTLIIIGSNNLTQMGLTQNIEASVVIEFTNDDPEGVRFLEEINHYFEPILIDQDANLRLLTNEMITRLVNARIVPTEAERRAQYKKQPVIQNNAENAEDISDIFPATQLQAIPPDFTIQRAVQRTGRAVASAATPTRPNTAVRNPNDWSFLNTNTVLVAELSGPDRWSQANFNLASFEGFFGATRGNNNYHISLRHVKADGTMEAAVSSQAVTVASSNYRFELRAAQGLPYPVGTKPIAVFIKLDPTSFLYHLLMPNMPNYQEAKSFLNTRWAATGGTANRIKRITTDVATIKRDCPNLPFWI